jgi:threonine/homoserine/homoserine lactone efflux protein
MGFSFPLMLIKVVLGIGLIFTLYPVVRTRLQIIGGLYLLTLAWRMAHRAGRGRDWRQRHTPNPEAWLIAVNALDTYAPAKERPGNPRPGSLALRCPALPRPAESAQSCGH